MRIHLITTGGTFDKHYADALSAFTIGEPMAPRLLQEARVSAGIHVDALLRKDSLELTDADRDLILERVRHSPERLILITHGTDTLARTAEHLTQVTDKVVVLTGAHQPARMRDSDAAFNLGMAVGALQVLPEGIYIAMNGNIFKAGDAQKNRAAGRFETRSGAPVDSTTLHSLRQHLDHAPDLSPEQRTHLLQWLHELEHEVPAAHSQLGLQDRMNLSIERLEAEHPVLSQHLRNVLQTLSNIGI